MKRFRRDEEGYIVVETIGAFMLFVFMIASILCLVQIVALQARVHFAMTQTALTLSMYNYATELPDKYKVSDKVGDVIDTIGRLAGDSRGASGQTAPNGGADFMSNAGSFIKTLLKDSKKAALADGVIRPLFGRYLGNGTMTGDQYLKSMQIDKGLRAFQFEGFDYPSDTTEVSLIDRYGTITLKVRYEVPYRFWSLPLPFPKLTIIQTVSTRAWMRNAW